MSPKRKKAVRLRPDAGAGSMEKVLKPPGMTAKFRSFTDSNECLVTVAVCVVLAVITLAAFVQTLRAEFINFDDNIYIYNDPAVTGGLTFEGIEAAFSLNHSDNWVPLTTISHMLDCQVYGLSAGGHHLTNILLHTAAVLLLFLALRRMTSDLWPSAFVAILFAIHPLRTESVAWITERKDVLSGFFFGLTLYVYAGYARNRKSRARYLALIFFHALGLMSKPMLVTLPFLLLLLDYWPLKRFVLSVPGEFGAATARPFGSLAPPVWLVLEKIPLFAFSAASCLLTVLAEKTGIQSTEVFPLPLRIANALMSCTTYLWQMFAPIRLGAFYPYPSGGRPVLETILAFLLLAAISLGVVLTRQRRPYLLAGWLWFLGMLVPVVGFVQVGGQAHADRHTYLPQIGLYIMVSWAIAELSAKWHHRRLILGGLGSAVTGALVFATCIQTSYWKNSETLWTHALAVTSRNAFAEDNLGMALLDEGRLDAAISCFKKALEIEPHRALAENDLGLALFDKGKLEEAIPHLETALAIQPGYVAANVNLGNVLFQSGRVDEAIARYQNALELSPDNVEANDYLACALAQKGQMSEAIPYFKKALEIQPNNVNAQANFGNVLLRMGQTSEAIVCYQKALAIRPDFAAVRNKLCGIAWSLATHPESSMRNAGKAVELGEQLDQISGGKNPEAAMTLAAAYGNAGRLSEAISTAQRALQLAIAETNSALAGFLKSQVGCYQAGFPFRDYSLTNGAFDAK